MKYNHAVIGGTFDRLHSGHHRLIDEAFAHAEKVTIGLTTEGIIKNKFLAETVEEYALRETALKKYLQYKEYASKAEIVPINDIFGSTLEKNAAQALFVTKTTYPNAKIINLEREKKGLAPLEIHIVPFVHGSDGKIITSERIRYGEIDRDGNNYMQIFEDKKELILPQEFRIVLKEPLGEVHKDLSKITDQLKNFPFVITVGDIISESLIKAGYQADIGIIDFRTRRHPLSSFLRGKLFTLRNVKNKAGTVNKQAVERYRLVLKKFFDTKEKQTLIINGEEDLLALPAILLAPLQSVVLYGQYDRGVVVNIVTEEMKKKVWGLLEKFE